MKSLVIFIGICYSVPNTVISMYSSTSCLRSPITIIITVVCNSQDALKTLSTPGTLLPLSSSSCPPFTQSRLQKLLLKLGSLKVMHVLCVCHTAGGTLTVSLPYTDYCLHIIVPRSSKLTLLALIGVLMYKEQASSLSAARRMSF